MLEEMQGLKYEEEWGYRKQLHYADEYRYVFTIVFVVAISVADSCDVIDKRQEGFILGCALDRFTVVTK